MKKLLLIGFPLLWITGTLYAQKKQENTYPVLLTNQTLHYSNDQHTPQNLALIPDELVNDHVYRIIQLKGIYLGESELGFTALEYLPKHAAIVSIPRENYNSVREKIIARGGWMARLAPSMKLSRRLFQNNIPEWAWIDQQQFKGWLRYFPDLPHEGVRQQLKSNGYYIVGENASEKLFSVILNADEVNRTAALPFIMYVQEMEDPGQPENSTARTNHRINTLQSVYPGAPQYDGSNVVVGIGDDGEIGPHIDYKGRLIQNAGSSNGDHGDHVAGTVFGAGNLNPLGKGMAPGAEVYYQSYPSNLNSADFNYDNREVRVTNSSYSNGCNAGYTNFTRQMDQDLMDNPTLLHVFSAGNNGTSDCNYGAGAGWGNVTGGHKIAKNVVAVANLSRLDVLSSSSSRGPASDGRIKPDVAAVGSSVFSTTNPNLYTTKSGTSMAAPGVAGTVAVLYEAFRDNNSGTDPESGLLKAILMNTSDDLGNSGPDFRYGYGRVNARRAHKVIEDKSHLTDSVTDGNSKNFQLNVPANIAEARIMLYWSDLPASTLAARALVNDLDLEIVYGGATLQPWVLDPAPQASSLNAIAVQGRDSLNNVEQITINNPSGTLDITVSGFDIPSGDQKFYVVYEFIEDEVVLTYPMGGEGLVPGETEYIRWDAPAGNSSFTLEYSTDAGISWQNISTNVPANRRYYAWSVPNQVDGDYKVRVSRNGKFSVSPGLFSVIGVPANLDIPRSCPDSLLLTWDSVANATAYVVYRLGARYMDSIGTTANTFFNVLNNNPSNEDWFSVAAIAPSGSAGRRALAIQKPLGVFNCALQNDVALAEVVSPAPGALPDCFNYNNVPVTVRLFNNGSNPVSNFTLNYSFDNGPVVSGTVNGPIGAGSFIDYTFPGSSVSLSSSHTIQVYGDYTADENPYNDTLSREIDVYTSSTVTLPYSQDFENFNNCSTASDCEQTTCGLSAGWVNPVNGLSDDIDWRTNSGPTPSNFTGPSVDHTPGSGNGKYLYLEASGGCDSSEAWLMSPCIDLTTATSPLLDFWYHMNGANMGTLSVDIFDGSEWNYDVVPVISGNQGTSWKKQRVNLLPYAGGTITVRFRGKTGNDYTSDVSIDAINFFENIQSPSASFNQDNGETCIDGVVNFTDVSTNAPTAWQWDIQPNTFAFVGGTNATSQDISVQFQNVGTYQVTLSVTNAFGNDTLIKTNAVTVDPGVPAPVFQDFEVPLFPPADWALDNPDGFTAWEPSTVTGSGGGSTEAALFDNFSSANLGQNDGLLTMNIDLRNTVSPILFFDVAHAANPGKEDSLIIDISTNCGFDFQRTVYQKGSSQLQTSAATTLFFIPSSAADWRRDTLDLAPYVGSNIQIRFRNYSDVGNAVYLDNIQLVSSTAQAPLAQFSVNDTLACLNDDLTFTDLSSGGTATSYTWDFGSDAVPNTASSAGPHTVKFVRTGTQVVTLTVSNSGGFSQHTIVVDVKRKPLSVFNTTTVNPLTVQFNDLSLYDPVEWYWDFGDGDTSSLQNPLHTYTAAGTYNVYQKVTNRCGFTDRTVTVALISTPEQEKLYTISLYPNPHTGIFNVQMEGIAGQTVGVQIMDLSGKIIQSSHREVPGGSGTMEFDLHEASSGVYMIRLQTENDTHVLRMVKE